MPHLSIWRRVSTSRRAASLARWKSWQAACARKRGIKLMNLGVGGGEQEMAHRTLGHVGGDLALPLLAGHGVIALGQREQSLARAVARPRVAEGRHRAVKLLRRLEVNRRVAVLHLQSRL